MVPAWRFWMFSSVVVLANACGSSVTQPTPVVPIDPPTAVTAPPPSLTRTVRGVVVDEDSRPVANARVELAISDLPSPVASVTDATGAFELMFESKDSRISPALPVFVRKNRVRAQLGLGGDELLRDDSVLSDP